MTSVANYEGWETLIAALPSRSDDWQVLIVGEGIALPKLQWQAEDLGSVAEQFLPGKPSREIWKWDASLNAFAVPRKDFLATRRMTPIKPLIAMALGIPVVASDLPALREVTADSVTYMTPGSPEELAQIVNDEVFPSTTSVAHLHTSMDFKWSAIFAPVPLCDRGADLRRGLTAGFHWHDETSVLRGRTQGRAFYLPRCQR